MLDKEEVRVSQPILYMLQGFSSVNMWGPTRSPVEGIHIRADMSPVAYVVSLRFSEL